MRKEKEPNDNDLLLRLTFIHSIHHAAHHVIYQLFIPFVIHEEKFGTNNHYLILLSIQSSSLLTKKK